MVADRSVMAASRLLGAAAACVILLSFAAESHESYWGSCIKVVMCQQIFSILALVIFLLKVLLKSVSNRLFFALASRSVFGAAIPVVAMYKKASLCKNFFLSTLAVCKRFCVQKLAERKQLLCV